MKKAIILLIAFLMAFSQKEMAQPTTSYGKSDPEAKAILDAARKKFKSYSSIKADFTLKISNVDNKILGTKKGSIWVKGNKYKVKLSGQEIYCDGKTIWNYNKDTKEVQVNNYKPEKGSITPASLFTDFYDKDFLYRLGGTSSVNDHPAYVIEMTPLDKSKPYFKVLTLIDKKSKNLLSTEVFEKGGTRYTYSIDNFTHDIEMNNSDFVFDKEKHPGVEVVDLRL